MEETEIILSLKNVYFETDSYDILSDVSLTIRRDTFVNIVGKSGSGKSTLLKVMSGLQIPDSGVVELFGRNIMDLDYDGMLPFRKRMGFAFQDAALLSNLSIKENLLLPLSFYNKRMPKHEKEEKIENMLAKIFMSNSINLRPAQLSIGEKKLISIARAMIIEPAILFLDEPIVYMDATMAKSMINLIKEYSNKEETTVICVANSKNIITELADNLILIDNGKIVMSGTKNDILSMESDKRPEIINDVLN